MRGIAVPSSPSALADWIEIQVLLGPRQYLSTSELIDLIIEDGNVDALAEYDIADFGLDDDLGDRTEEPSGGAELLVLDALGVIEGRATAIGGNYPLHVDSSGVLVADGRPIYRFLCALVARRLVGSRNGIHKGARLFEILTAVALKAYLGGESRAIGFPRRDATGFRECIRSLVRDMRDQLAVAPHDIPGNIKDLGVDVVAWRSIDSSPGNTVILVQCATGGDWTDKGVQHGPWTKIVKHSVSPVLAMSSPFIPEFDPHGVEWELMCGRGGIPLHRARLAKLVAEGEVPASVLDEMKTWSDSVADLIFGEDPHGEVDSDEMLAADKDAAQTFDCVIPTLSV